MNKAYDVTGRRELLIDDFLIDTRRNVELKSHFPVELPAHPGKPGGAYVTVMKTPDGYNLYYRGVDSVYKGSLYNNHPGEFVGLAQSSDGISWTQPELNRFPGKPVPANTLFYGKEFITHNFVPFYDTNPECQDNERYKAVAGVRETKGLFAYYSADGINWHPYGEKVMEYTPEKTGGHMLDSQNVVFYETPSMGADDFAYFSNAAKGCYFNIGTTAPGQPPQMLHSEFFAPDENCMITGLALFSAAVWKLAEAEA